MKAPEIKFKIAIVGEKASGKSTFLTSFVSKYKKISSDFLRFIAADRETFESDYTSVGTLKRGDIFQTTKEKKRLCWNLRLPKSDFPNTEVILETADTVGQSMYGGGESLAARKEEFDNEIKNSQMAMFFLDSVNLKDGKIENGYDYCELLKSCGARNLPTLILLTKADMLSELDRKETPKTFLEKHLPELFNGETEKMTIIFVSSGSQRRALKSRKSEDSEDMSLDVSENFGFELIERLIYLTILKNMEDGAFLTPEEISEYGNEKESKSKEAIRLYNEEKEIEKDIEDKTSVLSKIEKDLKEAEDSHSQAQKRLSEISHEKDSLPHYHPIASCFLFAWPAVFCEDMILYLWVLIYWSGIVALCFFFPLYVIPALLVMTGLCAFVDKVIISPTINKNTIKELEGKQRAEDENIKSFLEKIQKLVVEKSNIEAAIVSNRRKTEEIKQKRSVLSSKINALVSGAEIKAKAKKEGLISAVEKNVFSASAEVSFFVYDFFNLPAKNSHWKAGKTQAIPPILKKLGMKISKIGDSFLGGLLSTREHVCAFQIYPAGKDSSGRPGRWVALLAMLARDGNDFSLNFLDVLSANKVFSKYTGGRKSLPADPPVPSDEIDWRLKAPVATTTKELDMTNLKSVEEIAECSCVVTTLAFLRKNAEALILVSKDTDGNLTGKLETL